MSRCHYGTEGCRDQSDDTHECRVPRAPTAAQRAAAEAPVAPRLALTTCTHCHHALADHDCGWCYHRDCPCGTNGVGHLSNAEPLRCVNCAKLAGPLAGGLCAGCVREIEAAPVVWGRR
jgi:hypothetical protein